MNTTPITGRRKRPWLAFASVLLALTSFVSAQSNSNLSALVPSAGALVPVFDSATIDYTATVPFATTSMTVTPTVEEAGATITVNTIAVLSGNASDPIALSVGPNVITTVVTSLDTTTTKTYSLTVTRAAASTNADLSGLVPSAGTLVPVFDSGTIAYAATVPFANSSMTVTPTKADANATITVNGNPVASGNASDPIALSVGANVISTEVTAEDGSTTKTYTLTVTRGAASTNADLSGLVPSGGTLNPVFDSATIAYAATVQFSTSSMTVTPTKADANATITVNGNPVASGSPSGAIALSVGANVITTEVTAEDGSTTKTYTLTVTRAAVADLVTDFQATIASEENPIPAFTGEARFYHVSTNSANPGTGSYAATIVGTNNPGSRLRPELRWTCPRLQVRRVARTTLSPQSPNKVAAWVEASLPSRPRTRASTASARQQAKLWTSTDPGNDIKVTGANPAAIYGAVANTNATGGWRVPEWRHRHHRRFRDPGRVGPHLLRGFQCETHAQRGHAGHRLVDPAPDITIANAHLNNDTANRTEYYLAEIDFVTDGVYDEIEFVWTSGGGNGRGLAVVVTEAARGCRCPDARPRRHRR